MNNGLTFDGSTHYPIVAPASVPELGDLVRRAAAENRAIYPFGGGTMLELGHTPTKPGTAVDLRGLNRVIDYPARDMTITVQAGIAIGHLQEILHGENQRLAVDIPLPERATLGGAIAVNASGPRRFGLGTLRDYVIGISLVNDEGQEVKGGGRVVKNVAGYDLMKLYTGSLGTLGIITQVTLKLKPLPESSRAVVIPTSPDNAALILDALFASRTRPVCVELLDPAASAALRERKSLDLLGSGWNLVVGFEDNALAVAWQIEQLKAELPAEVRPGLRVCSDAEAENLWRALTDFALWPDAEFTFKANLLPSATLDFCRQASATAPGLLLQAHAGNGIVIGHGKGFSLEQTRTIFEKWGTLATQGKGNLIATRCPPAWKSVLPVWGSSTPDRILMKAVKEKLDPRSIFNPGRFADGI